MAHKQRGFKQFHLQVAGYATNLEANNLLAADKRFVFLIVKLIPTYHENAKLFNIKIAILVVM